MLKMDENNQYGQSITKPLPYGCIKKQEHPPSLTEFNRIQIKYLMMKTLGAFLQLILKVNDMNPKTLLFNEIYPPIFEKNKKMEPQERSPFQPMSIMVRNEDKDKINSFPYTSRTHSTLKDERFIPFCAGDLHFWYLVLVGLSLTFTNSTFSSKLFF